MTREQFLELLQDPSGLDRHSEADLALLSSRFPYCQPLHYLHLRKLSDEQSVHYPRHLKMAAAVAPDRKQLYHFLHPESSHGSEVEIMEPERLAEMPVVLSAVEELEEVIPVSALEEGVKTDAITAVEESQEPAVSASDILEQRLRELNLWQEEEQPGLSDEPNPASLNTIVEAPVQPPSLPTVTESGHLNRNDEVPVREESRATPFSGHAIPFTDTVKEDAPHESVVHDVIEAALEPEVAAPVVPAAPAAAESHDPLEELIQEEILQTRLRNADYFAEQGIDTESDTASKEQVVSAEPLNTISEDRAEPKPQLPSAERFTPKPEPAEEKVAATAEISQDGGAHSFLDWLHRTRNSVTEARDENVPTAHLSEELPARPAQLPEEVKEDVKDLPTTPPSSVEVTSPKTEGGQGTVFNFSPPRTIYMRKSKAQPEAKENEAVAQPLVPERPQAESQALSPVLKEEVNPAVSPAPSEEGEAPALPVRKPLADPESVLNDPPRPKVPSSQLIDNFIRQDPRITPNKSTFYSPVNMAKKSVQEPEDLVTETLAKVYAGQGNYAKAIQVYEKLRLKFPEKKLYFAALIQELKDKTNP